MVVAGSEGGEVAEAVDGDGVLGSGEANSSSVLGDTAFRDVVRALEACKEAIAAENGIGSNGRALCDAKRRAPAKAKDRSKAEVVCGDRKSENLTKKGLMY